MATLISILNSGESLEKAAVLTKLGIEQNPDFYSSYNKIRVFYFENLPRKDKNLMVHGSLGGIIENLDSKRHIGYSSLDNLWEDRGHILTKLFNLKRITMRMKQNLEKNKARFDRTIPYIPWYLILENFKEFLLKQLVNDSASLEFINFKEMSAEIIEKTANPDWHSRPYILNPDGVVSSRYFWKGWSARGNKNQLDPLKRSIILSPNVHLFLKGIYYSFCQDDQNLSVGFRRFNKTKRPSYDLGIKFLFEQMGSRCVEEPQNTLFNNLLDKVDKRFGNISIERKVNLAVYDYLNRML